MAEFFINNGSTIVIGVILLAVVVMVIRKMVTDRMNGKTCSSCGGGCSCSGRSCSGGPTSGVKHSIQKPYSHEQ